MTQPEVYVSITGLRIRRPWHAPQFWFHAIRSMAQARSAPGNILAETRRVNGVHHTLSVWTDRDAMLAYLASGAHLRAMRLFRRIATGRTYGFTTRDVPPWSQVPAIWAEKGAVV
jgi:quinol monooxygenase YgiN